MIWEVDRESIFWSEKKSISSIAMFNHGNSKWRVSYSSGQQRRPVTLTVGDNLPSVLTLLFYANNNKKGVNVNILQTELSTATYHDILRKVEWENVTLKSKDNSIAAMCRK